MYSKGDTIKFEDESIVLVLEDGMKGQDFVVKYLGQRLTIMSNHQIFDDVWVHSEFASRWSAPTNENNVWYNILLGDQNVWVTCAILYFRTTGDHIGT